MEFDSIAKFFGKCVAISIVIVFVSLTLLFLIFLHFKEWMMDIPTNPIFWIFTGVVLSIAAFFIFVEPEMKRKIKQFEDEIGGKENDGR